MKYTTVLGVDASHLEQLRVVWPTWVRHKPGLFENPLIVFIDTKGSGSLLANTRAVIAEHPDSKIVAWPPDITRPYPGIPGDKWSDPQRAKMLAGFVYVPAYHVKTDYWLKLDVDVVAHGHPDWIDPDWFKRKPAIVAQKWGFTKPADQMLKLDQWIAESGADINSDLHPPLNLQPKPGWSRVKHPRIISWCGFFNTAFTKNACFMAGRYCGDGHLPVCSQDGYLWYMAKRFGWDIVRTGMKSRGWSHWLTMKNLREKSAEALGHVTSASDRETM